MILNCVVLEVLRLVTKNSGEGLNFEGLYCFSEIVVSGGHLRWRKEGGTLRLR